MNRELPKHIVDSAVQHAGHASFYLYDRSRLLSQIDKFNALPDQVQVFYAMKANPNLELLKTVASNPRISGVEIASIGEAKTAAAALDGSLGRAIFTGPGKGSSELKFCADNNIKAFNIESLTEAHRISRALPANKRQPVLLRVSTDQEMHGAAIRMSTVDDPVPFGVGENEILATIAALQKIRNLVLEGLHFYAATGVLSAEALLATVDYAFKFTSRIEKDLNLRFKSIDLGGGFGIDYSGDESFDLDRYAHGVESLIDKFAFQDRELILELGRYIVADCGYFVTTICDIKHSHGKKVLITRAGTNAHRRPYALKTEYPITIIPMKCEADFAEQPEVRNEAVTIHGPLCTPADRLSGGVVLKHARIGDLLVMHKAGAYGLSMSAVDFLSHPKVCEFLV